MRASLPFPCLWAPKPALTSQKEASEVPRNLPGIDSEDDEHPASQSGASHKVAVEKEKMPGPSRTMTKEDALEPIDRAGRGMARVTRSRCAKRMGTGGKEDGQSGKGSSSVQPHGHYSEAAEDSKATIVGSRIRKRIALESPVELLSGTRNVRGRR